ncbi:glutathione S-transferase [Coniochaeta sp. 2T2.1]|nr:glutathione S-transferase [Coniochaeta sp. 2T2.1]
MPASVDNPQPSATGAALKLVQAHSTEHPLKLYAGWFCPFVQRAWIVLEEKNLPYQYVEINPYDKSPELLALNPRGLVPTLAVPVSEDGGSKKALRPLYESTVICEYLEEAYPDSGPRLLPQGDPYERARCRLWIDHVSSRIVPAWYRLMQHTDDKPYSIDEAREGLHKHLKAFVREMLDTAPEGPFFLGKEFSLVDVVLVPWAQRLWLIDHYKPGGVGIPKKGARGEDQDVWARWDRWMEAALERKSVKETTSGEKEYIGIYKRYAEDTTQSEVGQATRQGGKLP